MLLLYDEQSFQRYVLFTAVNKCPLKQRQRQSPGSVVLTEVAGLLFYKFPFHGEHGQPHPVEEKTVTPTYNTPGT